MVTRIEAGILCVIGKSGEIWIGCCGDQDWMTTIFVENIFKCIFFNENAWISLKISLKFVPKVRMNNILYWIRQGFGADQATSHYLNQWWLVYWHIYESLSLNELELSGSLWWMHEERNLLRPVTEYRLFCHVELMGVACHWNLRFKSWSRIHVLSFHYHGFPYSSIRDFFTLTFMF